VTSTQTASATLPTDTATGTDAATEPLTGTDAATEVATSAATETPTLTATVTLTPSATISMRDLKGVVLYQNHKQKAGILVTVLDSQNTVLTRTATDDKGNYSVQVPAESAYWVVFSAPLHLTTKIMLPPKVAAPKMILKGGDLDQNGCVDTSDLSLMTASFGTAAVTVDITGDGTVDARDLAILAGNLDTTCVPMLTPTAQVPDLSSTTLTPTSTFTSTASPTPTVKPKTDTSGRIAPGKPTAKRHK